MQEQVIFKKLWMEGFGSFSKPTTFPLDRHGINIIKGPNGGGKTTSFSALVWVLFFINLKGTKNTQVATWKQYRDDEFRGTRVIAELTKGEYDYLIARHLEFEGTTKGYSGDSRLMIFKKKTEEAEFKSEHLMGDDMHKSDMQAEINRIVGVGSNAFMNSVLFGQRMTRLIEADNDEKRELFEKLFAVEFVEEAKEKAKVREGELIAQINKLETYNSTTQTRINSLAEQIKQGEETLQHFEKEKKKRVDEVKQEIKQLTTDLKSLDAQLAEAQVLADKYDEEKLEQLQANIDDWKTSYETYKDEYDEKLKQINDFKRTIEKTKQGIINLEKELSEVSDTCPTCNGPLKPEDVKAVKIKLKKDITTEKKVVVELEKVLNGEAQQQLQKLDEEKAKFKIEWDKAIAVKKEFEASVATFKKAKEVTVPFIIQSQKNQQTRINQTKTRLNKEVDAKPPEVNLKVMKQEVDDKTEEIQQMSETIAKQQTTLSHVQWWIKTGFGAGGVKAFVFNAMLTQLNQSVEKYAARLGLKVKFSVDLSKKSKPFLTECFKQSTKIDYAELSGGEKQRIDICLSFAMHDIVGYKANVNLLIMDEVFEGLDDEGIETIFDLIRVKAGQGKTVYIITHSTFIDSLNAKHITIEKDEQQHSYIN